MRFWLVALMITLLPLRSWVGDAMALGMASHQVALQQAGAAQTAVAGAETNAAMPEDCQMHSAAQTVNEPPPCHGCDTCELCLAIASFTNETFEASGFIPALEPVSRYTLFSSADGILSLKPPIS